jgi:hypothetical protein
MLTVAVTTGWTTCHDDEDEEGSGGDEERRFDVEISLKWEC